ncbi:MAG: hypothetical protein KDA80_05265, partial [Planctomycetaceae bacterium]|nr:hypothetical protein [Planctomycetaceae bacterium]
VSLETFRRELSHPSVGLLRSLRRSPVWDVWPRALLSVLAALAARVPYLLGSTIVLESLYEIPGLGQAVWRAVTDVPVDLSLIFWVCVLGVVVSRGLSLLARMAELWLMPQQFRQSADPLHELEETTQPQSESEDSPDRQDSQSPTLAQLDLLGIPVWSDERETGSLHWPRRLWARVRFYLTMQSDSAVKAFCAISVIATFLVLAGWGMEAIAQEQAGFFDSFAPQRPGLALGADYGGDSVVRRLWQGLHQQWGPLLLSVMLAILVSGLTILFASLSWLVTGVARRVLATCAWMGGVLFEFLESLPKLVVLLAAYSYFDADGLLLKLYAVMGILFAPQLMRALQDELAPLHGAPFLEAMQTMRVPVRSIFWTNIFRNHLLHVFLIQAMLLVGAIVHMDALLGMAGAAKPGGVLTWGTVLADGTEQYLQLKPHFQQQFNDWVLLAPLIVVWLTTMTAFLLMDVLKILLGGYVHRR